MDDDKKAVGRPREEGKIKNVTVRIVSDDEEEAIRQVSPRKRALAILGWLKSKGLYDDESDGVNHEHNN